MEKHKAQALALELMKQHGLSDWVFRFDRARRRFGACNYSRREIRLSAPLTLINSESEVRNTILHEIAHAIAGYSAGHGPKWKAEARRIGARPERCGDSDTVSVLRGPWRAICPRCSQEFSRFKRPRLNRKQWCPCVRLHPDMTLQWRRVS